MTVSGGPSGLGKTGLTNSCNAGTAGTLDAVVGGVGMACESHEVGLV